MWVTVDGSVALSFDALLHYPLQFYKCVLSLPEMFLLRNVLCLLHRSTDSRIQSVLESNSASWYSVLSRYIQESKRSERSIFS